MLGKNHLFELKVIMVCYSQHVCGVPVQGWQFSNSGRWIDRDWGWELSSYTNAASHIIPVHATMHCCLILHFFLSFPFDLNKHPLRCWLHRLFPASSFSTVSEPIQTGSLNLSSSSSSSSCSHLLFSFTPLSSHSAITHLFKGLLCYLPKM